MVGQHSSGHHQKQGHLQPARSEALDAGAFGVPTFFLHCNPGRDEMFFGLDHMDMLGRACEKL